MYAEALLTLLIIGFVAGFLANTIAGGRRTLVSNILVGIVGSVIGSFLANLFEIPFYGFWGEVLVATLGAVILLALFRHYNRGRYI
jgi:uncharacterized membrane protein YeaQ/YmgE (transglycosylase-associated protein family)